VIGDIDVEILRSKSPNPKSPNLQIQLTSPLPRAVKLLGYTSLFTDAATEAVYPLLPVFVTRVLGGSPRSLGIIEGAADATASVFKLLAGRWSDRTGRRKPFVLAGYTIAGLVRPLIALAATWQHVFVIRLADRVGKGLRGAPRDAMLDALAPEGQRGRVFGYHRGMDHAGAVLGPLLATLFLYFAPGAYRTLFALTIIPGVLAMVTLRFVPETRASTYDTYQPDQTHPPYPTDQTNPTYQTDPIHQTTALPTSLKRFLAILAVFTLGNSSDAFLLLRLSDAGLATSLLPMAWAGLHVVKSGLSTPGGALSDRFGRHRLIIVAWLLYAIVYAGFAVTTRLIPLIAWFLIYGIYFALAEGSERALVADLMHGSSSQGTAFGWYNAVLGFGALAASLLFGFLWESFGPSAAFYTGAVLAITASALLAAERSIASPS
jgi:MFS family permease